MSKVFYYHTTKLEATKIGLVPACTIALQKDGNTFKYGVSICSKHDNFTKKSGREIAEMRLNNGFGSLNIPVNMENMDEKQQCLSQLHNLVLSIVTKNKKWKRKVTKFNQEKIGTTLLIDDILVK